MPGFDGTGPRGETTSHHHSLLTIPSLIIRHDLGVSDDISCRELWQFIGLSVKPTKRFQSFKTFMLWEFAWHDHMLMIANLWHNDNASNLFDLRIVRRRDAIEIARNLCS